MMSDLSLLRVTPTVSQSNPADFTFPLLLLPSRSASYNIISDEDYSKSLQHVSQLKSYTHDLATT